MLSCTEPRGSSCTTAPLRRRYLPAPKTTDMDDETPHGGSSKKSAIGGASAAILMWVWTRTVRSYLWTSRPTRGPCARP